MRIIAGQWRGRKLVAPSGRATRPTADRTRETLFNMLASRIGSFEGLRIADLYAGSGALGFEAMSRGAAQVTFVETDPAARAAIMVNARTLGIQPTIASHSAAVLPAGPSFDLILADPPYSAGSGTAVVQAVEAGAWLAPGGWLAIETARGDGIDAANLVIEAERDSARARLTLLRRAA